MGTAIAAAVTAAVTIAVVFLVGSLVDNLAAPIVNLFTQISVDPMSIPIVNQVILWSSICAAAACIVIRVFHGVHDVMLQQSKPGDFGRWVVKTVLSIACIAFMPLFCNLIISVGTSMFTDVQSAVSATNAVQLADQPLSKEWLEGVADTSSSLDTAAGALANSVLVVMVLAAIVVVVYQLFKRQIMLLYVTAISSWVAVKASMDSFDDVVDLLCSLFGLVVTQWVQYLAMAIAISMVNSFMGDVSWVAVDITADGAVQGYVLVLAFLGAALGVPQVIERYAFAAGRSGAGNMIVGMAVRGGFGSMGKVAHNAGQVARGIAR